MSYAKLSQAFRERTPFKYDKFLHFDGTKVIGIETSWLQDGFRWKRQGDKKAVLAEWSNITERNTQLFTTEATSVSPQRSWLMGSITSGESINFHLNTERSASPTKISR